MLLVRRSDASAAARRPGARCVSRAALASLAILFIASPPASAQIFNARRMAMGGVVLRGGGGLTGANVAYRAVPAEPDHVRRIALPLGLVQFATNPPQFDPKQPDFNAFELANLLYDLPWNLQIGESKAPSSDVAISVGRDQLTINLGDMGKVFPAEGTHIAEVANGPDLSWGFGKALTVGVGPLIEYQTTVALDPNLYGALAHADPVMPNTEYGMTGSGQGQAAVGLKISYASQILGLGSDPRAAGGFGLYGGARIKLLRGLAYADGQGAAGFTTPDTLFGNDSVAVHHSYTDRTAAPADGGLGYGLDLGAVWVSGATEVGLGVNDVATRINWKTKVSQSYTTPAGNDTTIDIATGQAFTSTVPTTVTANVATRVGPVLLAGDVVRGPMRWSGHAGAEHWLGMWALRGGLSVDENKMIEYACGTGVRLGHLGFDLAVATNSQNISRTRTFEIGAGVALY